MCIIIETEGLTLGPYCVDVNAKLGTTAETLFHKNFSSVSRPNSRNASREMHLSKTVNNSM